jgi:integral membrane sensor domain MASE1
MTRILKKSLASLILAILSLAASLASFAISNVDDPLVFFLISAAIGFVACYLGMVSQHTIKKSHTEDRTALKIAVAGAALGATAPWLSLCLANLVDGASLINEKLYDLNILSWLFLLVGLIFNAAILPLAWYGFYKKLYKEDTE